MPALPRAQIRAAIDACGWSLAMELLAEHERELAEALAAVDLSATPRESWLALLAEQRALIAELTGARDEVATALQRIDQGNRGARAWLRELA